MICFLHTEYPPPFCKSLYRVSLLSHSDETSHVYKYKSSLTLYNVCAVPWGVVSTVGVFNTMGDNMSTVGGYLEYHGSVQYHGVLK